MNRAFAVAAVLLTGCPPLVRPQLGPGPRPVPAGSPSASAPLASAAPGQAKAPSPAPALPVVPKDAAHPMVAWFVAKTGEVPGFALGGLGQAAPPAELVSGFVLERAAVDIAPVCLRNYRLNKTAARLEKISTIHDAASLDAAMKVISEIEKVGEDEAKAMSSYSDQVNSQGAAKQVSEVLRTTVQEVSGQKTELGASALRGWVSLLEVCFDQDRPAVVDRNLGQLVSLLKTGRAPGRGLRPQLRYVHPGLAQFLRLAGDQLPLAEFAALLALDPSDTLRGGNLEVSLFASDLTMRELTPRALELCGAKDEAAAMAKLGPITSQASLEKAANLLGSFESQDTQRRLCLEAAQNLAHGVFGAAFEAISYQKSRINSHPYYARGAFSGWLQYRRFWATFKVPEAEIAKQTKDLLERTIKKLRQLPPRKETSREPS